MASVRPEGSLAEAQAFIRDNAKEGVSCPCCAQLVKIYRRGLTSSMVRGLLICIRQAPNAREWFHAPGILEKSRLCGDFAKLRYWGLIEPRPRQVREDGSRRAGEWRVTERGLSFGLGRLRVPSHIYVHNSQALGAAGDLVGVAEALGAAFNYRDLMGHEPFTSQVKAESGQLEIF